MLQLAAEKSRLQLVNIDVSLNEISHVVSNKNESMVSFVSRRYMRVVNGILVVLLVWIGKQNVKIIEK